MSQLQVELVPFHGDNIEAIRDINGMPYVGVKRICENLGVDFSGQLSKLKATTWACVESFPMHDSSGREQLMTVIPVVRVPMWMATIRPSKVAPEIREKIGRYQIEAADVLARFFTPQAMPQEPDDDPYLTKARLLVETLERSKETRRLAIAANKTSEEATRMASEAKAIAEAAMVSVTADVEFITLAGFGKLHKLGLDTPKLSALGRKLTSYCKLMNVQVRQVKSMTFGSVGAYPISVLESRVGTHSRRDGSTELVPERAAV